jgi:hypothetical protein
MFIETSDVTYLYKNKSLHRTSVYGFEYDKLDKCYFKIKQSYIDKYGIGKDNDYLISLKLKFVQESSRFLQNKNPLDMQMAKITYQQIKHEESKIVDQSISKSIVRLSKSLELGYKIDLNNTTLEEYYDMIDLALELKPNEDNG